MKNAIIYARYSSDKQTELSIDAQLAGCYRYAKEIGVTVVKEYIDRAYTGTNDKRPEFQQMLLDSAKHEWDTVIVYKLDRFARNRYDSAVNKRILKKNGIAVCSALERISTNPEGILLEAMLEGYSEYYSAELSQKIKGNREQLVLQRRYLGGPLPWGYKIENKKILVDNAKAKIVRKVFQKYIDADSLKEVISYMQKMQITNNLKKYYTVGSLHYFIGNKKYIGIYEDNGTIYNDYIPQILKKEIFNMAKVKMENRKKGPAEHREVYHLSGKIFCGLCGEKMEGGCGTSSTGKKYFYYKCLNNKNHKGCDTRAIRKEDIEDLVVNKTLTFIYGENFHEIVSEVVKIAKKTLSKNDNLPILQDKLKIVDKQITNIIEAIKNGIYSNTTKSELDKLEKEQGLLNYQIQEEQNRMERIIDEDMVCFLFDKIKKEKNKNKQAELIISTYVDKVEVFKDYIKIYYNILNKKNKKIPFNDGGRNQNNTSEKFEQLPERVTK